jgi:hypothetical protein
MENAGIFKKKIYQHNYLKFLINLLRMKKYKPSIINIGNTIPFRPDKKKSSFNRFRNIENVSIQHVSSLDPVFRDLQLNELLNTRGKNIDELFHNCNDPKEVTIFKLFISKGWLNKYSKNPEKTVLQFNDYISQKLTRKTPSPRSPKNIFRSNCTSPEQTTIKKYLGYRKKWIVTFGINNYLYWNKLNNAQNDSKEVLKSFLRYGFEGNNYTNEQVTKTKIEQIFKNDLSEKAHVDDLVVISFHMHGHSSKVHHQPRGFIVPYNSKKPAMLHELICISELVSWLSYIQSRHVLLLFDCCFSGFSTKRNLGRRETVMIRQPCRVAINAGTHQQTVLDGGWGNHSVFTGALLSLLDKSNNVTTITQLYNDIASTVTRIAEQTPTMGRLPGDMGGEIYIRI